MRGRRVTLAAALLWALNVTLTVMAHAACPGALPEQGRAAALVDARTVRLDDGRMLRLAGLELMPGAPVPAFPTGTLLHWRALGENDRYGRIVALVAIAQTNSAVPNNTLQQEFLAQGTATIGAELTEAACLANFRAAEAAARAAKRGIWSDGSATKNAERLGDHAALVGQFGIFEGKVLSVREQGATLYVNFGSRATQALTVTVAQSRKRAIEAGGVSLASLQGRKVRIRGFVEERGGPRIEARTPAQIEIVE
jgi:hypothetical protein